jgi:CRISPR-associated endonuclease Csn1
MSEFTLGIDLGPTSIGWALLDEGCSRLVAAGVRVFPEGVERDTSGTEISKNEQRRIARGMRRQTARRARRKRKLRVALVEAGLLPRAALYQSDHPKRVAWERDQFKDSDPYALRRRALAEALDLHEIGRVLVHLNQRRGFLSNRKSDRAKKKENSEILAEISELEEQLENRTLGEELANRRGDDPKKHHLTRVRGLHTRRQMYEREFASIWESQQPHHPDILTDELRERIHRIIFFQRNIQPPSPGLIGRCELEPRVPRCPRADRRAQRFRLFQEVNNLRVLDTSHPPERPLRADEREKLFKYLSSARQRSFDQIRKHLFEQHETIHFNLEAGGRTKLLGMPTDAAIAHKEMIGRCWHKLSEEIKDRIVAAIIDDAPERLMHLLGEAELDPAMAESLLNIDLEDGYISYGLHAIKKLLPHLQAGLPLTSRDDQIPCALRNAGYVMPWEHAADTQPYLPDPPDVTNPLVRTALHEVRKVVNAILRDLVYQNGHTLGRIHIELAREARGTAEQRRKRSLEMRNRERLRADTADKIRETDNPVSRDAINRYLLWREQGEICIYSGRVISLNQLLGGEVDIDHILPRGRSLDDSMMNKVVCFRAENSNKSNRTPYEWLASTDPLRYEQIIQRAKRLPPYCYPKLKRFYQESVRLDDFFARQFVDTTYITTQVHQYVKCLGARVLCIRGQHTAELRRHWGLNTVLRNDALDLKNREDHRHHAVDAVVIALTNESRLQQLARIHRDGGTGQTGEVLHEPWNNFRNDVETAVNKIFVSYRVRRKVSGSLHNDTIYGPTTDPQVFTHRKPLESLTPPMVSKIRDRTIRQLVTMRLRAHGIEPKRGGGKIPADVWKEPLTMLSGIPIKKVRILESSESIRPIRAGKAFVQPGNTHHLCVFKYTDDHEKIRKDTVFVSMLEAMERVKRREPVIQRQHPTRPDASFVMSLSGNEMLLIKHGGVEDLYRFETAASTSKQMWFRHHTFAGRSTEKSGRISKKPNTFEGRKVTIDPLGRIRWAND